MNRLGCELSVVGYGRFSPSASENLRARFVTTMKKENKGLYHFLTSPDFYLFLSAARDYTSLRRWTEAVEHEFADSKLFPPGENRTTAIFPFELTKQFRFFHYSRTLSLLFGLGEKVEVQAPSSKVSSRKLTRKERNVLTGLVKHPELTDVALSEEIDASRQVISNMKRRFERNGLIRTARTIDLTKLGYEILAFVHVRLNPKFPLKSRVDGLQKTVQDLPNFLMISGNSETMMSAPFMNYDEYFKTRKDTLSFYTYKQYLQEEPMVELIALSETEVPVDCDFSSAVGEAVSKLPK
jgi:DNA-binding Lrp family transcriptional regulator